MKLNLTLPKFLRIGVLPSVLIALMGIAFISAMARYAFGIGAISDLSYSYPWGFWISFDLFTGVVISSGGFLMAGSVYILGIKEFQPLLRPVCAHCFAWLHHGCHCLARGPWSTAAHLVYDDPLESHQRFARDRYLRDELPHRACHRVCARGVGKIPEIASYRPSHPQVHHALRHRGCGALHLASILPRLTPAHPADQTAPALVDSHPADHVLHIRAHCRHGNDHLRVVAQFTLFSARS